MKYYLMVSISIIIGLIITLLSAYFIGIITPSGLSFSGYPFNWKTEGTIGANRTPVNEINWLNLFYDLVLWSAVPFIILWIYSKMKKKKSH